ncbi:MAG: pilus assembly protein TadG-related protein [Angustibacter sp.]
MRSRTPRGDDGQITVLALGFALIAFVLVAVVADAAAVHLARTQLTDVAEAAALDAADALADTAYGTGIDGAPGPVGPAVPLTDESVRQQTQRYLATYEPTSRLDAVRVLPGTGTSDGQSATVALAGRARLPIAAFVVASWDGGITVTATATARAPLRR